MKVGNTVQQNSQYPSRWLSSENVALLVCMCACIVVVNLVSLSCGMLSVIAIESNQTPSKSPCMNRNSRFSGLSVSPELCICAQYAGARACKSVITPVWMLSSMNAAGTSMSRDLAAIFTHSMSIEK